VNVRRHRDRVFPVIRNWRELRSGVETAQSEFNQSAGTHHELGSPSDILEECFLPA